MTVRIRKRSMLAVSLAACGAAALLLAGCSGPGALTCESSQRYANSRSIGPLRIPDDLSAPKQANALRIPPVPGQNEPGASAAGAGAPCLESPPTFHSQDDQDQSQSSAAAPQRSSAETPRRGSRRRRRERNRP